MDMDMDPANVQSWMYVPAGLHVGIDRPASEETGILGSPFISSSNPADRRPVPICRHRANQQGPRRPLGLDFAANTIWRVSVAARDSALTRD